MVSILFDMLDFDFVCYELFFAATFPMSSMVLLSRYVFISQAGIKGGAEQIDQPFKL